MSTATSSLAKDQSQDGVNPAKRDHRQEVTDSIINMLEKGVAPWQKPWEGVGLPVNPTTDRAYRGGNAVHLMATGIERGYQDPRWMTYKQAAENEWQVRKGEKGTRIEFWEVKQASETQAEGKQKAGEGREESDRRFIHRIYTVFNAQQIDGIPAYAPRERPAFEAVEEGERILANSGASISHDQLNRCFYDRSKDSIHLTPKESFNDAAGYYGTALHELSHWSGHPTRLNRQTLNDSYKFGDQTYAREELRAELASLFISAETGIPHNPESHAAYVGSWVEALRNDKNEIFRAAHDASVAADFVLALDQERMKQVSDKRMEPQPERENSRFVSRLEPGSGTVGVHDKLFGDDHHTPINQAAAGNGDRGTEKSGTESDLTESFQEARALAIKELGLEAKTFAAQTHSGTYRGKIIGETEHHLVQSVSPQSAVAHLKHQLPSAPAINQNVAIAYRNEQTQVRELRERSKAVELER